MSIQAVAWVLARSDAEGTDRLVAIVMANHANERDEAWPSARTIAAEARISTNTAVGALRRLVDAGELVRVTSGGPRESARYRFAESICRQVVDSADQRRGSATLSVAPASRQRRDSSETQRREAGATEPSSIEPKKPRGPARAVDNAESFDERNEAMRAQHERARATSEAVADLPALDLTSELDNVRAIRDHFRDKRAARR